MKVCCISVNQDGNQQSGEQCSECHRYRLLQPNDINLLFVNYVKHRSKNMVHQVFLEQRWKMSRNSKRIWLSAV